MVSINVFDVHREIHNKLMRRKNPSDLWGSPFDNAWVGYVLSNHVSRDEIVIRQVKDYLERWCASAEPTREERNTGAASFYIAILAMLKEAKEAKAISEKIEKRIDEISMKEKTKFSLFNSPEIFYAIVAGLSAIGMSRDQKTHKIFTGRIEQEVIANWSNRIHRFAFYAGAGFELGLGMTLRDAVGKFLSSISLDQLDIDDVIPLLWFITKYVTRTQDALKYDKVTQDMIQTKTDRLWEQFENQRTYLSYDIQSPVGKNDVEVGTAYTLSTFELAMVDEMLAYAEKSFRVNPSEILHLLQLHPVVKEASDKLFRDGHFSQAVFEAYKALINLVKKKSERKELDGTDLMSKVFGIEYDKKTCQIKRKPILQLNELNQREDIDEQKGFMFLFMGSALGIRDPKAHADTKQMDPHRTLEYLAFASLLAERVDEATRNDQMDSA